MIPQWGSSKYRIDLVVQHPTEPGRFVLAVECDGATYHSTPTARDRDRLRQEHLEALGWRFHRIWSTDWFLRREEEIERAVAAYDAAVADADVTATVPVAARPDAPTTPVAVPQRGPKPSVTYWTSMQDYSLPELSRLVRWIEADGIVRTDDEIVTELMLHLGRKRRTDQTLAVLAHAIRSAHR